MSEIYIFDMDGTITDSMAQFRAGMEEVLSQEGVEGSDEILRAITPLGLVGTARYFVEELGINKSVDELVDRLEIALKEKYSTVTLKEGAREYLVRLKSKGGRIFILSANHPSVARVALEKNGIMDLFEGVWSVFDFGATKSELRLFDLVAEKLNCDKKDIEYYDDSPIAVDTATRAGLDTYGVEDRQSEEDKKLILSTAKHYVKSFVDLL